METVVILEDVSLLDEAEAAAKAMRPDDTLIFTALGLRECIDLPDGRHVHWFNGEAKHMAGGIEKRRKYDVFGGFLYATRNPESPEVQRQCDGLARFGEDARPHILRLG